MKAELKSLVRSPWLPRVPSAWRSGSTKYFFSVELGKMLQNAATSVHDIEVPYLKSQHVQWAHVSLDTLPTMWASPKDVDVLKVSEGDLLVCEGGDVGRAAFVGQVPPENCIFQNALHRVRSKGKNDTRMLGYLLKHASEQGWFDVVCNRATIAHFTVEKFGDLYFALPAPNEQRAIAGYLDRETKRLDELVRAKEGLLELVAEKRRALITRAVTRGLNAKSALRDSGIPWLGLIPAHWEIERSKWLLTERDERSTTGQEEMLTVSHITGVTPRSEKDVNMFEAETKEGYKLCQPGDLVINTLWAWMGAMGTARVAGMVSPAYNVYTPGPRLTSDYVDALVRIPVFAQEAIRFSKGVWSSRLRLYPEGLYEIWFPVPPLAEQRAIVAHIATETAKLDALRASAERTIRLLKERRSALISAAVTGKIAISATTA
jgi:type I restriction enzyme, S subunit